MSDRLTPSCRAVVSGLFALDTEAGLAVIQEQKRGSSGDHVRVGSTEHCPRTIGKSEIPETFQCFRPSHQRTELRRPWEVVDHLVPTLRYVKINSTVSRGDRR